MLNPLYIAVSWVLLQWHRLFEWAGLDPNSGLTWAMSIMMLVVTIRILLFRFFIKQVHSQRKMQEVQPKIAALREKYKNDRQTLSQEMMKLQKDEGFNPLGGCLPILLQAPVFLSLFHVLRLVGSDKAPALYLEYHWTQDQANSAGQASIFGAPIASAFNDPRNLAGEIAGTSLGATRIVAFVLIVLMVAATYITQRQIISRNTQVVDGQQAMIQKLLLYGMPASLFVSGFFFPIGVLFYWFTNNLWTMGQQFYIIKRMPHPNAAKKDEDKPAIDPKLLAPKPGQKPVRPRKGTPALTAGPTDAADPSGTDDAATEVAGAPASDGKPPTKRKRSAGGATAASAASPASPADGAGPTNGQTPAADAGTPDGAAADGDGDKPAPPAPRPKSGGGGARPGGARRPQGQRSPTQTRQKKKRR